MYNPPCSPTPVRGLCTEDTWAWLARASCLMFLQSRASDTLTQRELSNAMAVRM